MLDLHPLLRRERDSNPRYSCPYTAFRVRPDRPLRHLSRSITNPSAGNSECKYRDNSRNCKGKAQKKSVRAFWHGFGRPGGGALAGLSFSPPRLFRNGREQNMWGRSFVYMINSCYLYDGKADSETSNTGYDDK